MKKGGGGVVGFFFQAEDGIRDHCVTGVQTCALPSHGSRQGLLCLYVTRSHEVHFYEK